MQRATKSLFVFLLALILFGGSARAGSSDADNDTTPVTDCAKLPPSASVEFFSWRETAEVCKKATRILEGVRIKDLRIFEKGGFLLAAKNCGPDTYEHGVDDLIEIVRRRGLFDKPERWYGTVDLVVRLCEAFKGLVSSKDVIELLRTSGPMAKTLSDEGLRNMLIVMKQMRQQGD